METVENYELSWALDNLLEDEKDKVTLIKNVLDVVKSYMNNERYIEEVKMREQEEKKAPLTGRDLYVRKLMQKGATFEEAMGK